MSICFISFMWQSVEQIGNRADRLTIGSDIYLYSSNDIEVLAFSYIITSSHEFYWFIFIITIKKFVWVKFLTRLSRKSYWSLNFSFMVSGHIEESSVYLPSGTSCWFCTNCLFERNNGESWRDYAGGRGNLSCLISILIRIILIVIIARWIF